MATVISSDGAVRLEPAGPRLVQGDAICPGDRISTGAEGSVDIRFTASRTTIGAHNDTTLVIPVAPDAPDVSLTGGLMRFISSVAESFTVRTPHQDAGIDGTEAVLAVDGPDTLVLVIEGLVSARARGSAQSLQLRAGEASYASATVELRRATPDTVPPKFRELLLNPAGASDWAIHYPPVVLAEGTADPAVAAAAGQLAAGNARRASDALRGFRGTPADEAAALALRSVAATFRNDAAAGRSLAEAAVAAAPERGAGHVALGYALQAAGEPAAARDATARAVEVAPGDAYAWARLAELELTLGNTDAARTATQRSLALRETALGRSVEGLTALAADDVTYARGSFLRAAELDDAAPLPRLGLGLAAIREGNLDAGRAELEAAVALDPRQGRLRTWLGRAYSAEFLNGKALAQYDLALQADPDDQVARVLRGYELLGLNRPVEALQALGPASDARATQRDALGLEQDRAIRNTTRARIFDTLGFEDMSRREAAAAFETDPTSADANRALFLTYDRPGFEVARTSALLRATLLENRALAEPGLTETDLSLLAPAGPGNVTFYELSPLFRSDGWDLFLRGVAGNNGVLGSEATWSITEGAFSFSAGYFSDTTDGFNDNDDVSNRIFDGIAKWSPTAAFTLTAEARIRDNDEGERFLQLEPDQTDPDAFIGTPTRSFERSLLRLGGHWEASQTLDVLAVGSYADFDRGFREVFEDGFGTETIFDASARNAELQAQKRLGFATILAGGSWTETEGRESIVTFDPVFDEVFVSAPEPMDSRDTSLYGYLFLRPFAPLQIIGGLAYETSDVSDNSDEQQVSPKIGARLDLFDDRLTLRAAYARTHRRTFISDQTLEPVTIAGFNQFYDDFPQTKAEMVAVGADLKLFDNVFIGAEYVHRDLEIPDLTPVFDFETFRFIEVPDQRNGQDDRFRADVNATLGTRWSVGLGVEYSDVEAEQFDRPGRVTTWLAPASVRYFDPSGVFAGARLTWFDQEAEKGISATTTDSSDTGVTLDANIGYRLPGNRGVVSLEGFNLLDEDIELQNTLSNSSRPTTRPLAEDFSVLGRVTVRF